MLLSSLLKYSPGRLRLHLFRDLLLLVLFAVGTLVIANYLLILDVRRDIALNQISQAKGLLREEMRRLLEPVAQQLAIMRDQGRAGDLSREDSLRLTASLMPTMRNLPQVSGLSVTDQAGGQYFLQRDGDDWLIRLRAQGDEGKVTWRRWDLAAPDSESWQETLTYDPLQRDWYQQAVEHVDSDTISWSRPYIFYTRAVPGITASTAWREGDAVLVVAMDVTLSTILDTIDSLALGDQGRGFMFRYDGAVYLSQTVQDEQAPDDFSDGRFFSAGSHGGTLAIDAVAAWQRQGRPEQQAIQFSSGDQDWWGGFMALYADKDAAWLGVALPLGDIFTLLQRRWHLVLISALAVILVAVLLALLVVRKYSRQIRDMPKVTIDRDRYGEDLQSLIHRGENMHLEFKSTMRMNLRSGKPGKEIELAWLKGVAAFLNTEGGIVILGVEDDGNLLGLAADVFENEDRCRLHFKNLFNQHLGPQFSKYVRFETYTLDGRLLAAVECERAEEPVFLVHNQGESFYIRSGPSNMELSISQALSYLRRRF